MCCKIRTHRFHSIFSSNFDLNQPPIQVITPNQTIQSPLWLRLPLLGVNGKLSLLTQVLCLPATYPLPKITTCIVLLVVQRPWFSHYNGNYNSNYNKSAQKKKISFPHQSTQSFNKTLLKLQRESEHFFYENIIMVFHSTYLNCIWTQGYQYNHSKQR